MTNEVEQLNEAWRYEFSYWKKTCGFNPVALIESEDRSEAYEMDLFHIFQLENGSYATVLEQGCSCYLASDAEIAFCRTLEQAREQMKNWRNGVL